MPWASTASTSEAVSPHRAALHDDLLLAGPLGVSRWSAVLVDGGAADDGQTCAVAFGVGEPLDREDRGAFGEGGSVAVR
ncbi:hypothetical protein [Streptomyces chrestomyceticus]|uniref:hypothetical protein n=1 Tax=Streptomyces chrestomyceticus TaxID=68185 RepID=UPI000F6226AA|nr:hypothetical protein [Streptomyces chrestomyceticus]